MILSKEQINRYMRHIIMPEVSGPGQKKLLESTMLVYAETVEDSSPLIYYAAALGIVNIICYFKNDDHSESLFRNIRDLNNDISIESVSPESMAEKSNLVTGNNKGSTFRIIFGNINFIHEITKKFTSLNNSDMFLPTIIAIKNQWKGILQTSISFEESKSFMEKLMEKLPYPTPRSDQYSDEYTGGSIFSSSILGALSTIEFAKLCLNLGGERKGLLYFDIFSLEFNREEESDYDVYLNRLLNSDADSASLSEVSAKLFKSKILIVGTGGLGSPASLALSMAGVGTIGLVDYDAVEISNLNRQILHSSSRLGMPKVESAKSFLKNINPNVNIITYNTAFNKENAIEIIKDYDIVIDGVDNFPARFLLNDACFFLKKPMIEAGVLKFSGLNTTIIPHEGHCYRCAFPNLPSAGSIPSCAESGVLGPVPGVMGFIQAAEAVKLATGKGNLLKNKFLYFEALDMEFTLVPLNKNPLCPLCSDNSSINTLEEYDFIL